MITTIEEVYEQLKKPNVEINTKFSYSSAKTEDKVIRLSLGRIWFNLVLPEEYPLVDEPVTKKLTNLIMIEILNKFGAEIASDTISTLNDEAFKMQTVIPVTFKVSDFILPPSIQKLKDDRLTDETDPVKFQEKLVVIAEQYLKWLKKDNSGMYDILASGAKGNVTDIAVLLIARGSSADFNGKLTAPSTNSVNEGFTLEEFYENANQARSSLFIRSVGSAVPGDTSRITAFANSDISLSKKPDCGTARYIELEITKDIAGRIIQRFHMVRNKPKLISVEADVIGKMIKLRSPLHCIARDGICETCYGLAANGFGTKTIGLLASNVIGTEVLNSFTMKARHVSSSVNYKAVDLVKDLIY